MLRVIFTAPYASHFECFLAALEQTHKSAFLLVLVAQNVTLLALFHIALIIKYSIIIATNNIIHKQKY